MNAALDCECPHERTTLVKLDCGAGGIQFRRYCLTCWSPVGGAIAHAQAEAEQKRTGITAPLADRDVIYAAQRAYWRRSRSLAGSDA